MYLWFASFAKAQCGLPMCFRCGQSMSGNVRNHRCADIREEVGSYEICSNCYTGPSKLGRAKLLDHSLVLCVVSPFLVRRMIFILICCSARIYRVFTPHLHIYIYILLFVPFFCFSSEDVFRGTFLASSFRWLSLPGHHGLLKTFQGHPEMLWRCRQMESKVGLLISKTLQSRDDSLV